MSRIMTRPGLALVGALTLAAGSVVALAPPAAATTQATLFEPHQGSTAEGFSSYGECRDLEDGEDGWHFVLRGNSTKFVSVTASFDSDGDMVADTDVTAPGPDGTVGPPTAKHAYVYTPTGWTLINATAEVDGPEVIFNLSHTCPGSGTPFAGPDVSKEAATRYTETYDWTVDKNVDKTFVTSIGTTHTANYTIDVTKSGPELGGFEVFGAITIGNPNSLASGTVLTITDVTDALHEDGDATCLPDPLFATPFDLAPETETSVDYVCTFPDTTSPTASGTNSATVSSKIGDEVLANVVSNDALWDFAEADVTTVNDSADLTDSLAGDLGAFTESGQAVYSLDFDVPARGCVTYDNTATVTFTTGSDSDDASVEICRPTNEGGYTIGYWQNRNGQAFVKSNAVAVKDAIDDRYNKSTAPALPAPANSTQLAKWVFDTVKAPVAGNPVAMFDKQYLASVLSTVKTPALLGTCINAPTLTGDQVLSVGDYQEYVQNNYAAIIANSSLREAVKNTFDSLNNNNQPVYAC